METAFAVDRLPNATALRAAPRCSASCFSVNPVSSTSSLPESFKCSGYPKSMTVLSYSLPQTRSFLNTTFLSSPKVSDGREFGPVYT